VYTLYNVLNICLCISGTKSNDFGNPDYVPSINMGYSCENSTNGELHHSRFQRVEKRETDKQKRDAPTSLLKVSNNENQPQHGNYLKLILSI
jgi:hypothetical protein